MFIPFSHSTPEDLANKTVAQRVNPIISLVSDVLGELIQDLVHDPAVRHESCVNHE